MVCAECGVQLDEKDNICPSCGAKVPELDKSSNGYDLKNNDSQIFDVENKEPEVDDEVLKAREALQEKMRQLNSLIQEEEEEEAEKEQDLDFLSLDDILNAESLLAGLGLSDEELEQGRATETGIVLEEDIDYENNPRYAKHESVDENNELEDDFEELEFSFDEANTTVDADLEVEKETVIDIEVAPILSFEEIEEVRAVVSPELEPEEMGNILNDSKNMSIILGEELEEPKAEMSPEEESEDLGSLTLEDLDNILNDTENMSIVLGEEIEEAKTEVSPEEESEDLGSLSLEDLDNILNDTENMSIVLGEELEETKAEVRPEEESEDLGSLSLEDLDNILKDTENSINSEVDDEVFLNAEVDPDGFVLEDMLIENQQRDRELGVDEEELTFDDIKVLEEIDTSVVNSEELSELEATEIQGAQLQETASVENLEESFKLEENLDERTLSLEYLEQLQNDIDLGVVKQEEVDKPMISQTNTKDVESAKEFDDFSLEDLDNIEKILNAKHDELDEDDDLGLIQKALITGVGVEEFNTHKSNDTVVSFDDISDLENEIENEQAVEEADATALSESDEAVEDGNRFIKYENSVITYEMYDRIRKAVVDHEKVEVTPFTREIDELELLRNVRESIEKIKKEMKASEASKHDTGEELLEFEKELLATSKDGQEAEIKVVEEVGIEELEELEDFVDFDEIEDEDNILRQDNKLDAQGNVDDIIKHIREDDDIKPNDQANQSEDEDVEFDPLEILEEEIIDVDRSKLDLESQDSEEELSELEKSLLSSIGEEAEGDINAELTAIEDLLVDVIGEMAVKREMEELDEIAEMEALAEQTKVVVEHNEEHVFEYQALRLDLDLFYPGTQDIDNLTRDIEILLAKEPDQVETELELNVTSEDLQAFDFEELKDKDIADALMEIRVMNGDIDEAAEKRAERRKKTKRRKRRIIKVLTLGHRVRIADTFILLFSLIVLGFVGVAGFKAYQASNLTVSVQSKAERKELGDTVWESIQDVAESFVRTQDMVRDFKNGEVSEKETLFALSSYIDQVVMARENFSKVDLPTYSQFKYDIETFMSTRMALTDAVIKDIENGNLDSANIKEFLELETDPVAVELKKQEFFDLLGI